MSSGPQGAGDDITSSDDICSNPVSARTRRKPTSTTNKNTTPVRQLALRSSFPQVMKPRQPRQQRPLQRKTPQKRSRATRQDATPPPKRVQQQVTAAAGMRQTSLAANEGAVNARQPGTRGHEGSGTAPPEIAQPQRATLVPRGIAGNGGVNNAMHPGNSDSNDTPSTPTLRGTSVPLTHDVMLELFKASEQRILKHIASQQRVVLSRVDAVESLIKDLPPSINALKSGVTDLKMMVLPGSSKSSSQRTSTGRKKNPRNRTKAEALQDEVFAANPTLRAELMIVMDETDIACVAADKTIALLMLKFHRNRDAVSISSRVMNIFLYSCKNKGKGVLKDGIGSRHADFRLRIVKTAVELAKMLPDQSFGVERASLDPDNPEHVSTGPQRKPAWLISDLVDLSSLILARKHHEWSVSKLPKDPTAPEKRKAFYISKRFFKMVVDTLRKAREKSKVQMYEDGLYCLVNWEQEKWCSYDIPNPLLSFLWPEHEVISASAVPDTVTGDSEDVREANFELLETIISGRKEMLVEVTYDVLVSNEPTAHARKKDEN